MTVVNLKCFGKNDDRELSGREVWNTVTLALSFALAFTAYKSIQMLQSSLNQKDGLGVTSLACVYACAIISCISAPTVIKFIGGKLTVIIAWVAHSIYILSNFYPSFATLIPSSVLLGLATGSLWTSQGLFLSSNSESLAKTKSKKLYAALSKLNGIFFTILETSQFTGNIISSLVLNRESYSDEFQNVTRTCGAQNCPLSTNATKIVEPNRDVVYILLGIYLAFDIMALVVTVIFISPLPKSKWSKEKNLKASVSSCFSALGDYKVLLLLPLFLFTAVEQALFWADVTKSFISCPFGINYVGYICATYGASTVASNFVFSRLARITGRHFLYALASTLIMTILILIYFWTPDKVFYLFIIAFIWGITEGVWQAQTNALIAMLFPDKKEPVFANHHCWTSIGFSVSFITSNFFCTSTKLLIVMTTLGLTVVSYVTLEIIQRKKKQTDKTIYETDVKENQELEHLQNNVLEHMEKSELDFLTLNLNHEGFKHSAMQDDSTEEANGDDIYRDFIFHPNFQLADKGSRIKLTGNSLQNVEYGLIQHIKNPLTVSRCSWFKMKVEEFPKDESFIMFGLNECCKEFGGPMWDRLSSLRYCSDTGGIFTKGVGVRSDYPYGKGDEIICLLEKSFPDRSLINFLKNGKFVGREWAYLESDNLYATIGINKGPASLIVEWPRLGSLEPIMRQDLISNWVGCRHIELKEENSTATMAKDDVDGREAFAIQSPRPFNKDHTYFEVTLLNRVNGEYGPCIGVTAPVFNKYRAPGWDCFTFGYHGDDGAIFHETPESYVEVNDEWKCNLGDRIGIGIIFPKGVSTNNIHDIQPVMIYITKNGQYLRHKCILQPRGGFYPTLSLFRKGDKVKVCYPCTPPKLPTNVEHDLVTQGAMVKEFRFLPSVNVSNSDKHKGKTIQVSEDDKCPYRMVQYIKEAMEPNTYFEVTLGEIDTSTDFRIGIATRSDPVDSTSLEEGVCKCCFSLQHRAVVYNQKIGPKVDACKSGDTIGCYMVSRSANGQEFTMCFYINDINIGIQTIENKAGLKVYPTIVFGQLKLNVDMKWLQKKRLHLTTKNLKSWVIPSKNVLVNKNTLKMIKPQTNSDSIICHSPIPVIKNDISYLEFKLTEKNLKGNFPRVGVRTLSSVHDDKTVEVLFKPEECVIGDIIGCNVTLSEDGSHPLTALIQFYKNSVVQYKKLIDLTSDGLCFAVEFTTAGDSVSIKFDAKVPISLPSLEFKDHQDTECSSKKQNTHENKNDELADGTGLQSNLDNFNYLGTAVFISHTNSDIQKVNCIFHKLKMDNCFVDMSLWHPEEDNKKEIISSSEIIIFCLSNASLKDKHQQTELKWISKAGIPIIPLLLEDMPWPPGGSNTDQKKYFNKYDHVKLIFSDIIIDSCMLIKYIDDTKLNKPRTGPTYADFTDVPPPAQYSSHNTSSKACEIL